MTDEAHHAPHPTTGQYVKIAILLAIVTAVEVALFYIDEAVDMAGWDGPLLIICRGLHPGAVAVRDRRRILPRGADHPLGRHATSPRLPPASRGSGADRRPCGGLVVGGDPHPPAGGTHGRTGDERSAAIVVFGSGDDADRLIPAA